jgi:hypothetical protein
MLTLFGMRGHVRALEDDVTLPQPWGKAATCRPHSQSARQHHSDFVIPCPSSFFFVLSREELFGKLPKRTCWSGSGGMLPRISRRLRDVIAREPKSAIPGYNNPSGNSRVVSRVPAKEGFNLLRLTATGEGAESREAVVLA